MDMKKLDTLLSKEEKKNLLDILYKNKICLKEKREMYQKLSDIIGFSFTWNNTSQGWDYWHEIEQRLLNQNE